MIRSRRHLLKQPSGWRSSPFCFTGLLFSFSHLFQFSFGARCWPSRSIPFSNGFRSGSDGRRRLAAALTTVLSLLVIIGPATWLALGLVDSVRMISERLDPSILAVPSPPVSVKDWPLIGEPIYQFWDLASTNLSAAFATIVPQLKPLGGRLLRVGADTGLGILKFLIAVIVAGFLFSPATRACRRRKKVFTATQSGARRRACRPGSGDHPCGFARRDRHFSAAGAAGRHRFDSRRHSSGQPDYIRRLDSRNNPDRADDSHCAGHHMELDDNGDHVGAPVHGLHGAGEPIWTIY